MLLVLSDANGDEIATGTGFLVSNDGKLVTNYHVIENAANGAAKAENGDLFPIEGVLASDPKDDLALVKIKGNDLRFLTLGNSEKVEVGSRIAVIGSPLGLEATLSEGIVSAIRGINGEPPLLQITAAISRGSSGSPVLSVEGEVIGIATLMMQGGQAINFAVPAAPCRTLLALGQNASPVQPLSAPVGSDRKNVFGDADRAKAWFALGVNYRSTDRADASIAAFKQATQLKPDYAEAWYNMGLASENLAEKIGAFSQAVRITPNYGDAWYGLGKAYLSVDQMKAVHALEQAAKYNPQDAVLWWDLSGVYQSVGRLDDSRAALQRAIALNPRKIRELDPYHETREWMYR
ncbi:MAG: trypsin-like peptidase domain-containing protein [Verrucomicrobiia bacterium]|jgi:hypothetical protein